MFFWLPSSVLHSVGHAMFNGIDHVPLNGAAKERPFMLRPGWSAPVPESVSERSFQEPQNTAAKMTIVIAADNQRRRRDRIS